MKLKAGLAVAALAATAIFAGGASANHLSVTMSTGDSAKLVSGVYLVVQVQVTCPSVIEVPPFTFFRGDSATVSIIEKVGKTFAHGSGGVSYDNSTPFGGVITGTPFTCDDTPHAYNINVFPDGGSVPFHGGKAVLQGSADVFVEDPDRGYFGEDNIATVGPTTINIKG